MLLMYDFVAYVVDYVVVYVVVVVYFIVVVVVVNVVNVYGGRYCRWVCPFCHICSCHANTLGEGLDPSQKTQQIKSNFKD